MKNEKVPSVGLIVVWMICFYPVGIYLIIKRHKLLKAQSYSNQYGSGYTSDSLRSIAESARDSAESVLETASNQFSEYRRSLPKSKPSL